MKSKLVLFIIGFIIWMLLGGVIDKEHALVGVFVCAFAALLSGDMFSRRPHHFTHISRYLWFLYYIPLFAWECFKANIDVLLRVANPNLPINPGIVKVKTSLKSDTALTFLANSITLTPGTFCIDVDAQQGILYIHWIDVRSQDLEEATRLIVHKYEKILKRIFE